MKYHYQFVSPRSVRIVLIAEDKKETKLFKNLSTAGTDEQELKMLYNAALLNYTTNSLFTKIYTSLTYIKYLMRSIWTSTS